jgi:hypothetical protein
MQAYLIVRSSLAQFETATAAKQLAELQQVPAIQASGPVLVLVEAALAVMQGHRIDPEGRAAVETVVEAAPGWRYAHAVGDAVAMADDPSTAPWRLEAYVSIFGNDAYAWAAAAMHDGAKPALLPLLARELRYGAYDPAVWRALSVMTLEPAIDAEVEERLAAQLRAALTTPAAR